VVRERGERVFFGNGLVFSSVSKEEKRERIFSPNLNKKKKNSPLFFPPLFLSFLSLKPNTNKKTDYLSLLRNIIYSKLQAIADSGATVVLSRLAIGDLATQFFADRDIFCAGRVPSDDMGRVVAATGAAVQSTVSDLEAGGKAACLGSCGLFEEKQVGAERFNVFTGCSAAKSATLVLRGGSDAFVDEAERSLHDAVMIVRRAIKNAAVVAGGGAIDMELSR
jgi:chaperonin GroEL (HSP60 family)